MKINLKNSLYLAILTFTIHGCGSRNSSNDSGHVSPVYDPPVAVQEKIKFDGSFEGSANQTKYSLDLSNDNGVVSGTMKDGENSFLLNGSVVSDKVTGTLKYIAGDMPFEAYYQGPSLVVQLDKETMNAWKLIGALASDDANVLLADDKIVFDPN